MIGHDSLRTVLESHLPAVSLFVGPSSVGKWTLAEHLRRFHGVLPQDVVRIRSLTMDITRDLVRISQVAPVGEIRLGIVRLDGASKDALNVLLKTLEELPTTARIVLIGSELPVETITSRCTVFQFSLLSVDQVEKVLLRNKITPGQARHLAEVSGGQVAAALALAEGVDAKITVLSALRTLLEHDADALDALAKKWTDEHTALLAVLCREAVTQRWRVFDPAEVEGIGQRLSMRILMALRTTVRPRLVVRANLMSVLRGVS